MTRISVLARTTATAFRSRSREARPLRPGNQLTHRADQARLSLTAAGTVAAVALIAGCSSAGGATARPAATRFTARVSGTETISGQVTGAAALVPSGSITFPLILTGPVNTTGTITLFSTSAEHVILTFKTRAGNLVVAAFYPSANAATQPQVLNAASCRIRVAAHGTFTVTGAKSTGEFKDAHGSGTIASPLEADTSKLSNGQCDLSDNDPLLAQGAVNAFHSAGPLTVP